MRERAFEVKIHIPFWGETVKKTALMLADTRPALIGQMLLQIEKTNRDVFDEVIVFDTGLNDNDKALMQKLMPCRFIKYESPISNELLKRDRFKRFSLIMFARYEMFRLLNDYSLIMWMDTDMVIQGSLKELLDETAGYGFSILCEDPHNKSAKKVDYMRTNFFHAISKHRLTRAHREKQLKTSCQALHNAPPNRT